MPETATRTVPWVEGLNVGQVLRRAAETWPERDALVFPQQDLRWSWSELDARVDRVATGLKAIGVGPGGHVGIWSMNGPEWVVSQFAVGRLGAVLVNVNPAYRLHELEVALRDADVETLIVGCPFKSSDFNAMVRQLVPEADVASPGRFRSARLPVLHNLIAIGTPPAAGWLGWSDLERAARPDEARADEPEVAPSSVFNIQFTSGTTGMPKGAMLTHRNVLMNAFYVGQRLRYSERDRVCVPVPFYHCFGCVLGTLVCVEYGAAIVVPAPSFDAAATLAAVSSERCTALYGVPTMFVAELDLPDRSRFDLTSLRTGIMAGSPCPLPLMKAVMETLHLPEITIGYGLTEASPIITQTAVDDPIEVRVGTVGRPIPGVEVRLVDPIGRVDVPEDEAGEIWVRGHGVMAGYYKNAEATARVIDSDGWLSTGDLARRRADGTYRIVGRSKELIIRGGENIYPPEIEEFLHHHQGVAEVAIVGLPDPHYGEVVGAYVVPKTGATLTADDIRDYCRGQIAHFKVPKFVEIVEALPRTVTGKVRKHVLREMGIRSRGVQNEDEIPTC